MAFQSGQDVRIKNTHHVIGKVVRLRDSDAVEGNIYEVEVDPRHLYLRESSLEAVNVTQDDAKPLSPGSHEWVAEVKRAIGIMQAVIDNPDDPILQKAMVETLDKLGLVEPI